MTDIIALKAANAKRWANAKLTRGPEFARPAHIAFINKARYVAIARLARMPDIAWLFIAVAHYRESNADFATHLGQGDPLNHKTIHVPAGRGPFFGADAFERGAVDALVDCEPYAARLTDWSIAGMLTNLERFNGLKYANVPRPSPYIWSGTDQYVRGKVMVDHGPIVEVADQQLGCAGLIMAIMALDPTITFTGAKITPSPTVPTIATTPLSPSATTLPPAPASAPIGFWQSIITALQSLFKRK